MTDFTGGYTLISGECDGRPLPPEHLHDTVVRFTADTVVVTDRDERQSYAATYRLDEARQPSGITMTATHAPNSGDVAEGLVEKRGDTIRLIYALPGGDMPTEFKTETDKQIMVTVKNMKR